MRRLILPALAVAGAAFALTVVAQGNQPAPVGRPVSDPARPPFASYIAGSGLVEAASRNIAVGSPLSRVVASVDASVGDKVAAGAPLFRLDDRDLRAELDVRKAALAQARARLERLRNAPRAEEIPPVESRVKAAEAVVADLRNQVTLWERVADKRAITEEELQRRRFGLQAAEARLAETRSTLELLRAGSWTADVAVAEADVQAAEAQVRAAETEIERLVVRAPLDGTVLQVNVRRGEFASAGALSTPLMLFGALSRAHVRVDIDENDAWRFKRDARAVAYVRGNPALKTDLAFVYAEPFVIPKRSLTGDSTERVDTRVMQAVYSFPTEALPVYVGQQMDVFIEAAPPGGAP